MTHRFQLIDEPDLRAALAAPGAPVLVDVRDRAEFVAGRIPGSRHGPVHALGEYRSRLPANLAKRLIVIGDDELQARAAANFLVLIGFGDVAVLDGGISVWTGEIDRSPPSDEAGPGPQLRTIPS